MQPELAAVQHQPFIWTAYPLRLVNSAIGVTPMKYLSIAFLLALGFGTPAYAARCDGDFQLVRGSWISTPYCRAVQIAIVAREAGIQVSPETILAHPARADELCQFLGADYRVHPACEETHSVLEFGW